MKALSCPLLLFAPGSYGYGDGDGDGGALAHAGGGSSGDLSHSLSIMHLASIKVSHTSSRLFLPDLRLSLLPPDWNALALALQGNEETSSHIGSPLASVAAAEADPGGLLQQASSSVEDLMKLLSSSPMQGSRFVEFAFVSVGLLFLFWVSNYIVPDIIFRKVFHPDEDKDQNSVGKEDGILDSLASDTDGGKSVLARNSKATRSMGTSPRTLQEDTSKSNRKLGFGNSTKQNGKSRKGKA